MKRRFVNYLGHARKALVVLALSISAMAFAQVQTKVSGRVVDDHGEPLPGVAVKIQGTTGGTVTDFDGNYSLMCQTALHCRSHSLVLRARHW